MKLPDHRLLVLLLLALLAVFTVSHFDAQSIQDAFGTAVQLLKVAVPLVLFWLVCADLYATCVSIAVGLLWVAVVALEDYE